MSTDIPDLIAGALGVSRGTAYDLMREALAEQPAQQQQEPVAWRVKVETKLRDGSVDFGYQLRNERLSKYDEPLYTSPQAQRKPLTDEQILAANYPDGEENEETIAAPDFELICFARQIEAKLKEKNT